MNAQDAIIKRILELCKENMMTPNALSYKCGVPQSTIKSILNKETKNVGVITITRICEGFGINLQEFFDTDYFKDLEQGIE